MKKKLINFFIFTLSICSPLFVGDLIMKSLYLPKDQARLYLLSKDGTFSDHENNIIKYAPLKEYRHVAVFGGQVEFDYIFNTDSLGFRNTFTCELSKVNNSKNKNYPVAITGDSFTEGTGSIYSWTEGLQRKLCNKGFNSINLAISGYGIESMSHSLTYAKKGLNSKKAIFAIIPNDLYREHFKAYKSNEYSYRVFNKSKNKFTYWHIDNDFSQKQILSIVDKRVKRGLIPILIKVSDSLRFRTTKAKYALAKYFIESGEPDYSLKALKDENLKDSIKYINQSIAEYGKDNFLLVILPTKQYVNPDEKDFVRDKLNRDLDYFLKSINQEILISDLRNCKLASSDFYKLDNHPTEIGYSKIGSCALKSKNLNNFLDSLE